MLAAALQEEGVRHRQWLLRLEPPAVCGSYRLRVLVARPRSLTTPTAWPNVGWLLGEAVLLRAEPAQQLDQRARRVVRPLRPHLHLRTIRQPLHRPFHPRNPPHAPEPQEPPQPIFRLPRAEDAYAVLAD